MRPSGRGGDFWGWDGSIRRKVRKGKKGKERKEKEREGKRWEMDGMGWNGVYESYQLRRERKSVRERGKKGQREREREEEGEKKRGIEGWADG